MFSDHLSLVFVLTLPTCPSVLNDKDLIHACLGDIFCGTQESRGRVGGQSHNASRQPRDDDSHLRREKKKWSWGCNLCSFFQCHRVVYLTSSVSSYPSALTPVPRSHPAFALQPFNIPLFPPYRRPCIFLPEAVTVTFMNVLECAERGTRARKSLNSNATVAAKGCRRSSLSCGLAEPAQSTPNASVLLVLKQECAITPLNCSERLDGDAEAVSRRRQEKGNMAENESHLGRTLEINLSNNGCDYKAI